MNCTVVSTVTSHLWAQGSSLCPHSLCEEFACFLCIIVGFRLGFLPLSKNMLKLIGVVKFSICVNSMCAL